jgi:hypothetical protein
MEDVVVVKRTVTYSIDEAVSREYIDNLIQNKIAEALKKKR